MFYCLVFGLFALGLFALGLFALGLFALGSGFGLGLGFGFGFGIGLGLRFYGLRFFLSVAILLPGTWAGSGAFSTSVPSFQTFGGVRVPGGETGCKGIGVSFSKVVGWGYLIVQVLLVDFFLEVCYVVCILSLTALYLNFIQ